MTETTAAKLTRKDFVSEQEVRWCPGCGDYSILAQLQKLMPELGVPKEKVVFISGIGCSSRFPYYMNTYGFHTIHGRAPAIATGVKISNPELSVWVVTGDGDALSIGGNHLLHALRRNLDINILLFNNRIYGLTKGQYSPTSKEGTKTKTSPDGSIDHPVDPISFALGSSATFVARTVDTDAKHLQEILRRAYEHKGASFVEILQNCIIFNDGEWEQLEDRNTRSEFGLLLEHGKPLIFGKEGERKGIRLRHGIVDIVNLADDADPIAAGVRIHDEHMPTPGYASILASLHRPQFPVPLGVLRAVEKTVYETEVYGQIAHAIETKGVGTLESLLYAGDTWTVEP